MMDDDLRCTDEWLLRHVCITYTPSPFSEKGVTGFVFFV